MLRSAWPSTGCLRRGPSYARCLAKQSSSPPGLSHNGHRPFIFWTHFSSPPSSEYHTTFSSLGKSPWPSPWTLALGFIPLCTLGLGFWQVYRLRWKLALIDEVEDKLGREALWLPKRINVSKLPEFAYRRVLVRGSYIPGQTIYIGPRPREGVLGYRVVSALARPGGGSTVLVDRGFVSREYGPGGERFAQSPLNHAQEEMVTVEGLLRVSAKPSWFTPANKPEEGQWHWADIPGIAKRFGGQEANVQEVFVEEIFEGHSGDVSQRISQGIPVGRTARVELRNMHAVYAATWFSLSAATAAMFWAALTKGRMKGKGKKWRP